MNFKHTGVFPEQAANWDFIDDADPPRWAARQRAEPVCLHRRRRHSQPLRQAHPSATWTPQRAWSPGPSENAAASGLCRTHPSAGSVDDCAKFVEREIKRGRRYDAVIMDPPILRARPVRRDLEARKGAFGPFLKLVSGVLSDDPLFVIINSYTTGLAPSVLTYLSDSILTQRFGGRSESSDELGLPVTAIRALCLPVQAQHAAGSAGRD